MKNKKLRVLFGAAATVLALAACTKKPEDPNGENGGEPPVVTLPGLPTDAPENPTDVAEPTETADANKPEEVPEGMYRSELTNEIISEDLKNQRPIAVMVDNESTALPHF